MPKFSWGKVKDTMGGIGNKIAKMLELFIREIKEWGIYVKSRGYILLRRFWYILSITSVAAFIITIVFPLFNIIPTETLQAMNIIVILMLALVLGIPILSLLVYSFSYRGRKVFDEIIHYQDQLALDKFRGKMMDDMKIIKSKLENIENKLDNHEDRLQKIENIIDK